MELMRAGYADADDLLIGYVARSTWTGRLDAPDYMPLGSTIGRARTIERSVANRDALAGRAYPGTYHDVVGA